MDESPLDRHACYTLAARQWTLAQPMVSAFVGSLVRDFSARDDVMQEIAVAILDSYDQYDDRLPFLPWALGVARNQVRLYYRTVDRQRRVFDDQTFVALADAFAANAVERSQDLHFLDVCLEKIKGRSRELLDLRYSQDLKPATIGERMTMSANAVAKALQRIRDQLRRCICRQASLAQGR